MSSDVITYKQSNELLALNGINVVPRRVTSISSTVSASRLDSIKIIGITGSKGKSTTAYLVHEYIKSLGYKSILYSNIRIDSPASYININEPCDIPLQSENDLLNIIEEAEAYQADYIIIELDERLIQTGLTNEIPFNIKALTNIFPNYNGALCTPEEYVKTIKSFFVNIPEEECTCVFGMTGFFTREGFNELLRLNSYPKITYGTKEICELSNANYTNIDCLLYEIKSDLNGQEMKIRVKENSYDLNTNLILPHNAINLTCLSAIIEALNIFDANSFKDFVSNIVVPGREEVIRVNDRTIVIGVALRPALENFKKYQSISLINKIKVVIGAIGSGFYTWDKYFSSDSYVNKRSNSRRFMMNYLKNNADYAYLTGSDNAAESAIGIAEEMQGYLNNQIPSIIVDRREAIKRAIIESKPNDLIYIAGRGNRRIFYDSVNTIKLFQDKEVVQEILKEEGWSI